MKIRDFFFINFQRKFVILGQADAVGDGQGAAGVLWCASSEVSRPRAGKEKRNSLSLTSANEKPLESGKHVSWRCLLCALSFCRLCIRISSPFGEFGLCCSRIFFL